MPTAKKPAPKAGKESASKKPTKSDKPAAPKPKSK